MQPTTISTVDGADRATAGPIDGGAADPGVNSERSSDALRLPLEGLPCDGYTLLGGADVAWLIDMAGNIVHRFGISGFPPKLLPGGSLIGALGVLPGGYDHVELRQVSWTGVPEWSFSNWVGRQDGTVAARQHHDLQRQGNPVGYYAPGRRFVDQGTTLVLAHAERYVGAIREGALDDDVIYEVDWAGNLTGFSWNGVDHVDEFGFDDAARDNLRLRAPGAVVEWLHGNSMSLLGPNRWYDEGRREFHPENIIYSSRQANFVIIISRETGAVVWRIGPDFDGRPEEALGQMVGQHHAHLVPQGLPGAGNVLVFDNGGSSGFGGPGPSDRYTRDYSRVLEFNPVTLEVIWQYGGEWGPEAFYSSILGGAQRLPNGNTLITIGLEGRIIEVDTQSRVVWEHRADTAVGGSIGLYRAYRIPPEWLPEGQNAAFGGYATWASLFEAGGPPP